MPYTFYNIWTGQPSQLGTASSSLGQQCQTIGTYVGLAAQAYDLGGQFTGETRDAQAGDASAVAAATGAVLTAAGDLVSQLGSTSAQLEAGKGTIESTVTTAQAQLFGCEYTSGTIYLTPPLCDPYTIEANLARCALYNGVIQADVALTNGTDTAGNIKICKIALDLASSFATLMRGSSSSPGEAAEPPAGGDAGPTTSAAPAPPLGSYTGLAGAAALTTGAPVSGALSAQPGLTAAVPHAPAAGGAGAAIGTSGGLIGGSPLMPPGRTRGEDGRATRQWTVTEDDGAFWADDDRGIATDGVLT
jgi:hypothetical protein